MKFIGIDPGAKGALCLNDGGALTIIDMPISCVKQGAKMVSQLDGYALRDWFIEMGHVDEVIIERTQSMPGNAGQAVHNFGLSTGMIHGILVALDRPWRIVHAATWTKALGVGSDKSYHRAVASRMFPAYSLSFRRVEDDGRADAALLSTYTQLRAQLGTKILAE